MVQNLTGIHVFQKNGEIEWETMLAAVQLISALSWKRYHGRIELYTNAEWLRVLEQYGIDQVYDKIDLSELKEINPIVNKSLYWAWPKMQIARKLTKGHVMLDTDLWINGPIQVDHSQDFMGFHEENWSDLNPTNPYPDFDPIINKSDIGKWDKSVKPVNCALLWIGNIDLLNKWLDKAEEIAVSTGNGRIADPNKMVHQVFIEQRLLPIIAKEINAMHKTFLPIVYQSHVMDMGKGECWEPDPNTWTQSQLETVKNFIHIWGCKKMWTYDDDMRNYHRQSICVELKKYWRSYDVGPMINAVASMAESYTLSS